MRRGLQVELAVPRAEDEGPPFGLRVPQHGVGVERGPHGHGTVGQIGDLDALLVLLGTGRAVPLDAGDVEGVQLVPLALLARLDLLSRLSHAAVTPSESSRSFRVFFPGLPGSFQVFRVVNTVPVTVLVTVLAEGTPLSRLCSWKDPAQ